MTVTATATVPIRPGRLRQLGAPGGAVFCLVASPAILPYVEVEPDGGYEDYLTIPYGPGDSFADLLRDRVPPRAHLLVVSPDRLFESPPPALLGERKLLAMACNSTPTAPETVAHFVDVLERSDPDRQAELADRFFAIAEDSDQLEVVDDTYGTRAVFRHLDRDYEWNQQAGVLAWGEQQVVPGGELSALPAGIMSFDPDLRLALDGEIALRGLPILHSGAASFTRADQARIYADLATVRDAAVVATIDDGAVTALRATAPAAEPAAAMLTAMFDVDGRYRVVWELGFGINTAMAPAPGNVAMNEVWGGTNGQFHVGLGLTPFTQYALIVICPGTRVLGVDGQVLAGSKRRAIEVKRDGTGCGCRV
jgi:hypothetical protein